MAASLLHALDLPELVATSQDEYEATAVRLAREPAALDALRKRLAHQRIRGPVFDMRRYARHLEAAYREMVRRTASGEPPDHLKIERAEEAPGA
jgi:predicted O-linked N-acetylglucosamine transferase (SPINDLY family)